MSAYSVYANLVTPQPGTWASVTGWIPSYWSGIEVLFASAFAMGAGIVLFRALLAWFRDWVR